MWKGGKGGVSGPCFPIDRCSCTRGRAHGQKPAVNGANERRLVSLPLVGNHEFALLAVCDVLG